MAADFMARQAQLRTSFGLLLLALLTQCSPGQPDSVSTPLLNQDEAHCQLVNGLLYRNGRPFTGTIFSFFPATADTAEHTNYRDGREHGIWSQYYPGGRLRQQRTYDNGQKVGDYIAWWETGRKKLQYHFDRDEYEGTCREWNEKGVLIQKMNYHKGHEEGTQKLFYNDGKIRANYTIIEGRRYGLLGTKNCVNVSDSVFRQ